MARRMPSQLNMLLAVDKPVGCTSHDVVSQCRRALHERRVGHAGTLDPMASGVMVVGVGQATRLLGMLTLDTKSYVADISFGAETNTDDAEGEAVRTVAVANELRDPAYAREHLAAMLGAVEELSTESAAGFALDPIAALGATRVDLPGNLADDLLCGRRIPIERALADFDTAKAPFALVLDGGLKALARIEGGRFVMEHVFPQAIGGVR